jgi:hypothetical protein
MDKFAAFAQVLENPFLALRFRQDAQERQAILMEHGFNAQETQAICDSAVADDERKVAELFGQDLKSYFVLVIVIDAMPIVGKSLVVSK